jgi:hypothetical protein
MSPSATSVKRQTGFSTASEETGAGQAELHIFSGMKDSLTDELRNYWTDDQLAERLDSAQLHLCRGEPAKAIEIWAELTRRGGEEGDWGHIEYLDYLLRSHQDDSLWCPLTALTLGGRVFGEPWRLAAELLEESGRPEVALYMFSLAVKRLPDQELRTVNGPTWARAVRAGQRRLKWRTGVPLDDTDLLADMGEEETEGKGSALLELLSKPEVINGRLQFLARIELETAYPRWSSMVVGEDTEAYYRAVEDVLRAHARGRVVVVRHTLRSWTALEDAACNARHTDDLRSIASSGEGETVDWPPGRNQPCWCGSGTKYKKCCGANRVAALALDEDAGRRTSPSDHRGSVDLPVPQPSRLEA